MRSIRRLPAPSAPVLDFSAEQRQIIRDTLLNGATDTEAGVLIEMMRARQLNPLLGHVHPVKRWDSTKQREVWALQVAIDGFRAKAEESGEYAGQEEPSYAFEEATNPANGKSLGYKELVARVVVYRTGRKPAVGVARFSEFVQTAKDGQPVKQWAKMPRHMLAKCAEAGAFRKAFPEHLGGLYAPEEMAGDDRGSMVPMVGVGVRVANDNAEADSVALYLPRLASATTERALQAVAAEIRGLTLDNRQRDTLLTAYSDRLCAIRSTPPAIVVKAPELPETPTTEG